MRLLLLLSVVGCGQSYGVVLKDATTAPGSDGTGTPDPGVTTTAVDWEGASLVINSPLSGAFVPHGEAATFSATVYDAAGAPTTFDSIEWGSDLDAAWTITGGNVSDATLDVGTHTITASAALPNGDRLSTAVGGVLVQSEFAGIYSGSISITASYDSYALGCTGTADLMVDAYGEIAEGEASCLLDFYGYYELDTTYGLDLEVDDGDLSGIAQADLVLATYDFEIEGEVNADGILSASFEDSVYGYLDVLGEIEAERITRDVSGY